MQVCGSESMSTVSREDNLVFSSEDSSTPDEPELELGLGLALSAPASLRRSRILTAKDFPAGVSSSASSSASSSSSSLSRASVTAGTKRNADSVAAAANGARSVVFDFASDSVSEFDRFGCV